MNTLTRQRGTETDRMKNEKKPSRRGAPVTPRNRIPVGIRMTPEMRDKLVERSGENGRSITQEIELLLEQGLRDEELFKAALVRMYGRQLAGILPCSAGRFTGRTCIPRFP